ncbi:hypothetical protein TUM17560_42170 [Serratia marcescens]|nr:hypothetical protein TUM17560_42170 [Serratia marcescens]
MENDFNREALAIEIALIIPAQRVARGLNRIVTNRATAETADGHGLKLFSSSSAVG